MKSTKVGAKQLNTGNENFQKSTEIVITVYILYMCTSKKVKNSMHHFSFIYLIKFQKYDEKIIDAANILIEYT